MAYDAVPDKPGIMGITPAHDATVYILNVDQPRRFRIQTETSPGTSVQLELHLYRYPAPAFTSQLGFIEVRIPAGTHYVAVRSMPGGVSYQLWQTPMPQCPPGCLSAAQAAQALQELAANLHASAGLAPPTTEQVLTAIPGYARNLLAPKSRTKPRRARVPARGVITPLRAGPKHILPNGTPMRIVLTKAAPAAQLVVKITTPGIYEWSASPPPLSQQEVFYFTLLGDRGQILQSSDTGRLRAALTARTWTVSLFIPRPLLPSSKRLDVMLRRVGSLPTRPDLDHPPNGDGHVPVGTPLNVDIKHTHPKAQLSIDITTVAKYQISATEITGGSAVAPQANAPAVLTIFDSAGAQVAGPTAPKQPVQLSMVLGRWWVDVTVPDFHGRTTPRRYTMRVVHIGPA